MNRKTLYLVHAAVIAALYVVLTLLANALGLANYAIQVRFSEALTILPFFTPAAIPGLFVGCILSNLLTGCMPLDVVFGSLATLAGALGTYFLSSPLRRTLVPQISLTEPHKESSRRSKPCSLLPGSRLRCFELPCSRLLPSRLSCSQLPCSQLPRLCFPAAPASEKFPLPASLCPSVSPQDASSLPK